MYLRGLGAAEEEEATRAGGEIVLRHSWRAVAPLLTVALLGGCGGPHEPDEPMPHPAAVGSGSGAIGVAGRDSATRALSDGGRGGGSRRAAAAGPRTRVSR